MIIHILAGGPVELLPDFNSYCNEKITWVGVDRGVYTLLEEESNQVLLLVILILLQKKNFKSLKKKSIQLFKFKPEKDETDMELAFNWALEQNAGKDYEFLGQQVVDLIICLPIFNY